MRRKRTSVNLIKSYAMMDDSTRTESFTLQLSEEELSFADLLHIQQVIPSSNSEGFDEFRSSVLRLKSMECAKPKPNLTVNSEFCDDD